MKIDVDKKIKLRRDYHKYHKLMFADEEIYDEIVGLINIESVDYQKKFDSDYRKTLSVCLRRYVEIVKDTIEDENLLAFLTRTCQDIKDVVTAYYEGHYNRAYTKLKNLLVEYGDDIYVTVESDTDFYRMRVTNKRRDLQRRDIFHIPLNQRREIKTQRFSSPGYPCLYLGKSLYVCWEEMNMPSTETTLVCGVRNTQPIRLVDIRVPSLESFLESSIKYARVFPLIIACSVLVIDNGDVFKPEYIVPQLIIQWVINRRRETGVIGVFYTSVFKNQEFFPFLSDEWDNVAIPVQNPLAQRKKGLSFCPKLEELFFLTKPTCYEYERFLGNIDSVTFESLQVGNKKSENADDNYYKSQFSRMEEVLRKKKYDKVSSDDPD